MGSLEGVNKIAAKRIGIEYNEYIQKLHSGLKWCFACREWHDKGAFGVDKHRGDGLSATCAASRRVTNPRPYRGGRPRGWLVSTTNDPHQARFRTNYIVKRDGLPKPNQLPCSDCGHVWSRGERRHEFDHFLGYEPTNQLSVEVVCTICHAAREAARGKRNRLRGSDGRFKAVT